MENKDVKTRNRSKITVIVLTVFLLLCAVACVGTLLTRKDNEVVKEPEQVIVDGAKISVSDEATLRELLLEDAELVIEVTEDIVVDKAMLVNGTKTLTGAGSISMALYVQPYQYMLEVQKGASLIFDGVTVDGNGSSNCVKAEKDTEVTVLSGKLTYGCPTIIESFGDVYLKGGSIEDAVGTGMYIHNGGNGYLTGGTIQGCVDSGIETATEGYLSVSDDVILQDNYEYFIYNRGTCDITGGTLRRAGLDMVYTSGVMNVKYEGEADGMLEWYDIEGCGIVVGNGGELNVDGLHIKDVTNRAVTTAAGQSVANISNSLFENTKGDAIYVRTEVNLKNVEIKNSNLSGIMLIQTGKATIDNVTISDTVKDGIQNGGGVVTGKNLVVNNAGRIGVNSYKLNDVAASVTLGNVTINGTEKSNGLHVEASTLTVSNAKIYDAGNEGARAQKKGTLNLTNVEIQNSKGHSIASYDAGSKVILKNVKTTGGKRGVGAFGGNVTGTKVTVNSPVEYGVTGSKKSVVEITDLIIKDSGKTGVNANDATINITNATIENPKATAGVNADYAGKVTLKNAEIKFPEGATASVDGVKAVSPATITLEKVNFTNVPGRAVYANGEKAKIAVTDITTTGGKRGIQVFKAGQVEGTNISITSPSEYGISCGDEGSGFNLTNLTITECGKHGLNVYDGAVATATDVTITKPAKLGAFVGNKGQLTMNNVSISESGETGIINDNATLSVTKGLVEKANGNGVHTYKGGITKLTDCDVKDSANYNIRVDNENSKYVLSNVTTTGGKRGIQIYKGGAVEGNKVTITSPSQYGISCGDEGSSLVMKDLTVENCGTTGVNVYDSAVGTVTNATITKTGEQAGFVGNKGKLTFNSVTISKTDKTALMNSNGTLNVTGGSLTKAGEDSVHTFGGGLTNLTNYKITDSTNHNIRVDNVDSKCVLKDVTTTDGKRGIQIWKGGTVEGSNVTITSPSDMAITCGDEGSSFKIKGLTVNRKGSIGVSSGNIAVNVYGGAVAEVEDGLIEYPGTIGANVEKATLTLKGTFEVVKPGDRGIKNVGGTVEAGTATVKVDNPKSFGVSTNAFVEEVEGQDDVVTAGTTTIKTLNVNDAEGYSAMTVNGVGTVVTVNGGTISDSKGHGVNASDGKLILNNVKITDAGEYGIEAQKDSTIELEGVEITDGKRGIQIKDGGHVKGGTVTITSPSEYGLASASASSFEIANLSVSESGSHAVNVYGNSTAKVTTKLTITDAGSNGIACSGSDTTFEVEELEVKHSENKTVSTVSHGVNVYDGAELTVNGGTITNSGEHGANVANGAALTLKGVNIVFQKGRSDSNKTCGINADGIATLTLEGVNVVDAPRYGIYVRANNQNTNVEGADIKATVKNVTTTGGKRGIQIYNSAYVSGENVTITSAKEYGVAAAYANASDKVVADFNITNLVINKAEGQEYSCENSGVYLSNKANGTVNGGTITSPKEHGFKVEKGSTLTLTGAIDINTPKLSGIVNAGGTVVGNVAGKLATVNVTTPGEYGVTTTDGGSTTIQTVNVSEATAYAAVNVADANTVTTINGGTISASKQHGANAVDGTLTLNGCTITGSKYEGVRSRTNATVNLTNVTIIDGRNGIQLFRDGDRTGTNDKGGTVKGTNVTIYSPTESAIKCGNPGSNFEITNLQVKCKEGENKSTGGYAVNVYEGTSGIINGGSIENAGSRGVSVDSGAIVTLNNNVSINNSTESNLYVTGKSSVKVNGTLTTQGGTRSLAIYGGSSVTKGDNGGIITINNSSQHGVRIYDPGSILNISELNVTGSGDAGVEVGNQAQVTVAGGTISNTNGSGIYVKGTNDSNKTPKSKATISGMTISGAKNNGKKPDDRTENDPRDHGIFVERYGEVDMTNVTIENSQCSNLYALSNSTVTLNGLLLTNGGGEHSIAVYGGSSVTKGDNGGNIEINSPSGAGVRCYDPGSSINVDNLKVSMNNSGTYGVEVGNKGSVTTASGTISQPGQHGAYVKTGATLTLNGTTNITLANNNANHAVYIDGENSKVIVEDVVITDGARGVQLYNGARIEGTSVTVRSTSSYGIACGSNSSVEIDNVTVENSGSHSLNVYGGSTLTLDEGTITNPGGCAVNVDAGATLTIKSALNITSSKTSGLLTLNGTVNGRDYITTSN